MYRTILHELLADDALAVPNCWAAMVSQVPCGCVLCTPHRL